MSEPWRGCPAGGGSGGAPSRADRVEAGPLDAPFGRDGARGLRRSRGGRLVAAFAVSILLVGCGDSDPGGDDHEPAPAGEPCPGGDPARCVTGVSLLGAGGQCWCSAHCSADEDCPGHFPCQRYPFDGDHRDVCAPICESDADCPSGACDQAAGACEPPPPGEGLRGEACGGAEGATCLFGLVCVAHAGSTGRCMETCDPVASPLCESKEVCYEAVAPQGGICWLGGELAFDTPCTGEFDCAGGYLCVNHPGGQTCRPACDTEAPAPCEEGEGTCRSLDGGRLGACLP